MAAALSGRNGWYSYRMSKERSARILVADDDPVSLQFLVAALRDLDGEITGVSSGGAALAACQSTSFDLLLLDRRMPDLGGAPLLRELRRRGCVVVAIATSAELDATTRAELAEAGYADAVAKPIGIDRLDALLATYIPQRHRVRGKGDADSQNQSPSTSPAVLEDSDALTRVGGSRETLQALRQLFAKELEAALPRIAAMPATELGDWLHRLRASCRYCGATQLGEVAERIELQLKLEGSRGDLERNVLTDTISATVSALSKN